MGQTVPLTEVTDYEFANRSICEDKYSAECVLLEKGHNVTKPTERGRVNCSSPGGFRFKPINTSHPLKVACEVKKGNQTASWYFYVDKFGKKHLSQGFFMRIESFLFSRSTRHVHTRSSELHMQLGRSEFLLAVFLLFCYT